MGNLVSAIDTKYFISKEFTCPFFNAAAENNNEENNNKDTSNITLIGFNKSRDFGGNYIIIDC